MPPQPLRSVHRTAKVYADHTGIARSPELVQLVGQAIAIWAHVESSLANLLAVMLKGASAETAIAMFGALTSTNAQTDVLRAAAELALKDTTSKRIFEAIIRLVRERARTRHKFAHWLWTSSKDVPDALLLIDPRADQQTKLDVAALFDAIRSGTLTEVTEKDHPELDKRMVWVYRRRDLEEIIEDFTRISVICRGYVRSFLLGPRMRNRMHQLLLAEHQIQKMLARIEKAAPDAP
jgi:hypothetical protein